MFELSDELTAMAILGSARGSRVGFGGLAETIGLWLEQSWAKSSRSRGRDRQHGRPRALPQPRYDPAEILGAALLAMPGLRDVLNPWIADVIHQHKGQSVCVWPAKLIHAGASAIFGDRPCLASFLNRNGVAGKRIGAPDLCFWLSGHDVKCAVGINGPDRPHRVSPLSGERGWAGGRDSFACSNHCY